MLYSIRRQSTFEEVVGSFDESDGPVRGAALPSCGNCFECDNCYGVCPDNAVIKLGPGKRYEFNYDYCKGCGSAWRVPLRRDHDDARGNLKTGKAMSAVPQMGMSPPLDYFFSLTNFSVMRSDSPIATYFE